MLKNLSIGKKILLLFSLLLLVSVGIFCVTAYHVEKRAIYEGIDGKLVSTALAVDLLLPEDYHDQIQAGKITDEDYYAFLQRLTRYADANGVTWVYTYMERGDEILTTSSNATTKELETGEYTTFLKLYKKPSAGMRRAFSEHTTQFDEYRDEFGDYRSVFIPRKTPGGQEYLVGSDINIDFIDAKLQKTLLRVIGIAVGIFGGVFLLSLILARMLSRPLILLSNYMNEFAKRNFSGAGEHEEEVRKLAHEHADEAGLLAGSFLSMQEKLDQYLENLKETTAAKERVESELKIAHNIQMSMLPRIFPPFPNAPGIDLFAQLDPARDVGGDLYDFFFLDEHRLCFAVGDVSGKGVPASLFMVVAKTLLKRVAMAGHPPDKILFELNNELCRENSMGLFVTMLVAILDMRTGKVEMAYGGHNPAYIVRKNGDVQMLEGPSGVAPGVFEDIKYERFSVDMDKEDLILLYTDGVTEAMSPDRKCMGEDRLEEVLREAGGGASPKTVVAKVVEAVIQHANGADQHDDVTILAMQFKKQLDA